MFLGKEVRVLLKDQAKEAYFELKKRDDKEAQMIIRSINRMIDLLKTNPQFGDPIRKELIPKHLLERGIQNLYRAELSNFWRMIYTLEGSRIEIFCFVLSIVDHKEYNKIFRYKKH